MVDKVFEDVPSVYLEDVVVDEDIKASLQEDVMLYFPNATNMEEDYMEMESLANAWRTWALMKKVGLRLFQDGGKKWIRGRLVIVSGMTSHIEMWSPVLNQSGWQMMTLCRTGEWLGNRKSVISR
ncbi:hypothetical protein ACFX2J_002731 [Malus domestica]